MKLTAEFKDRLTRELVARREAGDLPRAMLDPLRLAPGAAPFSLGDASFRALSAATDVDLRVRTVVRAFERPSLLVQDHTFTPPVSDTWSSLLGQHKSALEAAIPAIGRIEAGNNWFGTGVLVAPDIVATNRHVALDFLVQQGTGWSWAPGVGGAGQAARIDFRQEHARSAVEEFELVEVLHVEDAAGHDLALFRIATTGLSAQPLTISTAASHDDAVAVVGYTSRVAGMPPEVEEILLGIFGTIYDAKRLAPGRVLAADAERLTHDCSTQGGNSGSAILDIATGALAGLHFEGGIAENYAVPAAALATRLQEVT